MKWLKKMWSWLAWWRDTDGADGLFVDPTVKIKFQDWSHYPIDHIEMRFTIVGKGVPMAPLVDSVQEVVGDLGEKLMSKEEKWLEAKDNWYSDQADKMISGLQEMYAQEDST